MEQNIKQKPIPPRNDYRLKMCDFLKKDLKLQFPLTYFVVGGTDNNTYNTFKISWRDPDVAKFDFIMYLKNRFANVKSLNSRDILEVTYRESHSFKPSDFNIFEEILISGYFLGTEYISVDLWGKNQKTLQGKELDISDEISVSKVDDRTYKLKCYGSHISGELHSSFSFILDLSNKEDYTELTSV